MNRILLDTHVFLWVTVTQKQYNLGKTAIRLIRDNDVFVSSITTAELIIKSMAGKLNYKPLTMEDLAAINASELVFSSDHAESIADFESLARHDPFDRMLLAQAKSEAMIFLTADQKLLDLKLPFVVDATT